MTMTITLPDEVVTQIAAEHISQQQLDAFVVTAVKAWLQHLQLGKSPSHLGPERPWSAAFQEPAGNFIERLIDENKALFDELARL